MLSRRTGSGGRAGTVELRIQFPRYKGRTKYTITTVAKPLGGPALSTRRRR
jgi:hypothetical protein